MNSRFEEISRKAAGGELTAAEREWLEQYLRDHAGKRDEVDWDAAFHAKLDEKIAAMPAMPGWERTERALRADAAGPRRVQPMRVPDAVGVLDRLSDWLTSALGFAVNMQAVAVALVLAQAGVLGLLALQSKDREEGALRSATQDLTPRGPLLRVSFRPDLREGDLRRVLTDIGGEIVGGPGQFGIYLVRIRDGSLSTAAQRLRDTGTTELVETVDNAR